MKNFNNSKPRPVQFSRQKCIGEPAKHAHGRPGHFALFEFDD